MTEKVVNWQNMFVLLQLNSDCHEVGQIGLLSLCHFMFIHRCVRMS